MGEIDRPSHHEATSPQETGGRDIGARGGDPDVVEERIRELQRWGRAYERDEHRGLIRNVRYAEPEWEHVCEHAARIGWPPATFVRLAALFEPGDAEGEERLVQLLCERTRQLADLVIAGVGGQGTDLPGTEGPKPPRSLATDVRALRGRIESLHRTYCHRHRSATYVLPAGIDVGPVVAERALESQKDRKQTPSFAGSHSETAGSGTRRMVERSVRFR
jgi:hypothetical protein